MQQSPRGHIAALDGVRGLAILSVLAYHFGGWSMSRAGVPRNAVGSITSIGYSGVDLFFVLSGFLISGILLDARGSPGWLRSFYARRLLRIFPLYYAAVAAAIVFGDRLVTPGDTQAVAQVQPWLWAHALNIKLSLQDEWSPLAVAHFWSLGVEEQFYLVWPWVVALLPRRALAWVCVAAVPAALALRLRLFTSGHAVAAYALMPVRIDALCLGALVAIAARSEDGLERWRRPARVGIAVFGIGGALLFIGAASSDSVRGVARTTVIALFCASLIAEAVASAPSAPLRRALELPLLRTLGKYSYGLYVLHHLIGPAMVATFPFAALKRAPAAASTLGFIVWGTALSMPIAWVSWTFFESRFLQLRSRFEYGQRSAPVAPAPARADLPPAS